jgi:EAL domain-containing protein (putative c-di-GMP-specific phosphodiesterase class I)
MIPEFYNSTSQLQKFNKLFSDQPIEKSHLMLSLPFETLKGANKTTLEIIERYIRNGIVLVPDGVENDERFTPEKLKEMGVKTVVLNKALYKTMEGVVLINEFRKNGIKVFAKNADTAEVLKWLNSNHVYCYSGTMVGVPTSEDQMILDILAREEM